MVGTWEAGDTAEVDPNGLEELQGVDGQPVFSTPLVCLYDFVWGPDVAGRRLPTDLKPLAVGAQPSGDSSDAQPKADDSAAADSAGGSASPEPGADA